MLPQFNDVIVVKLRSLWKHFFTQMSSNITKPSKSSKVFPEEV